MSGLNMCSRSSELTRRHLLDLRSTPLSRLPRLHPPPFSQPESPSDVTSPEGQVASELQGMYFVPLSERETEAQVKEEHTESSGESPTLRTNFSERCGVVLMFRDTSELNEECPGNSC